MEITARRQSDGTTSVNMQEYFDDVELESLYQWLDHLPLTRPKKNLTKDFEDGQLLAEVIHHYLPRALELHWFSPCHNTQQKLKQWRVLQRVLKQKLDLELREQVVRALVKGTPKVIERVLMLVRAQLDKVLEKSGRTWLRRELYDIQEPTLRLALTSPPSHNSRSVNDTPPGVKSSPRQMSQDVKQGRVSPPARPVKSEPSNSPRKYAPGEVPHNHPDRSSYLGDKLSLPLLPVKHYMTPLSDHVPKEAYIEKEIECQAKEETIQILDAKIRRLEHLLHLKDIRIDDLHNNLQQTIVGISPRKR